LSTKQTISDYGKNNIIVSLHSKNGIKLAKLAKGLSVLTMTLTTI